MKAIYFLKSLALLMLMCLVTNVTAREIPVANGATDTELAAALEQAETGDVILINGWVMIDAMVHIEKNVTIKAGVEGAGFDGGGNTRLFEIHPELIDGAKLVFENLDFTGGNGWGSDPIDGGVARIYAGVTEFISCYFYQNESRRGGAFFITENGTTVSFKDCQAYENIAYGDGDESRGGYLFTDGETHITHVVCKIYNNQSIGGRGGALCLFGNGTRRFFYCDLSNNKGGNWVQDPSGITSDYVKADKEGNPTGSGQYEGGLAFITGGATTFESCGIIANQSWSHSGIIRSFDGPTITFINSTIARNRSMNDRSPIWTGAATYTFVNTLFVDNLGQNKGNGAGFDGDGSADVHLNVFNSVFARNIAGGDGAVDIRAIKNPATQLTVKNSLIGLIQGDASGVVPVDNAGIPTKSNIGMYKILPDEEAAPADQIAALENSGVDFGQGTRYSKFGMGYYLLLAGSTVTKLGDPALLADYDLNTDVFGQEHPVAADGSIPAAPILASVQRNHDDSAWIDYILNGDGTAIITPKAAAPGVKLINTVVENGVIGIDFGTLKGAAKAELYSITGQKMENVFSEIVVSKGFYNLKTTTPGIYLLKVTVGGTTSTQRLIVK